MQCPRQVVETMEEMDGMDRTDFAKRRRREPGQGAREWTIRIVVHPILSALGPRNFADRPGFRYSRGKSGLRSGRNHCTR